MNILKKSILFFLVFSYYLSTAQIINPRSIPGLQLWLRADSNVVGTTNVSQWNDCSGNSNNASQSNSNYQPQLISNVLNGFPVISFNGTNEILNGNTITNINSSSMTVFIVASGASTIITSNIYLMLFGINNYNIGFWLSRHLNSLNNFDVYNKDYDFNSSNNTLPQTGFPVTILELSKNLNVTSGIYFNGQLKATTIDASITGTFTNANYYIGGALYAYQGYFGGDIAEILVYNTCLSNFERQQIEAYLDNKYAGSSVNLGPDINVSYGFCSTVVLRAGNTFSSYHWSTGATSDSIIVNTPGTYSVTVRDTLGFHSSDTIVVNYPAVNLPDTSYFCSGDSVSISTSLSGSYTYHWSTGKTTQSIYVKTPGKYWVTVTDASSCSKVSDTTTAIKDTFALTVSLGPNRSFCAGNSIGLLSGASHAVSYSWLPGGATTSTIPINATGNYSVTVTDAGGCIGSSTVYITINGFAPTVDFSYSSGCSNDSIAFTDMSTPSGSIVGWYWNFGDGATSTLQNPKHKFMPGNYIVKDSVVTNIGCSNVKTKTIHVLPAPIAAFTVDTACVGNNYTFTDQSSTTIGHVNSWYWNFGDGHHSFAQDTVHTYSTPGNFYVTLTIHTDSGCQDTVTHIINVVSSAPSPIGFTLYLPSNGIITSAHTINFAWNNAARAANYTLEYSPDSLFVSSVTSIPNITTTSTLQTIVVAQRYFWRVIAYGICGGSGTISDVSSFTIFSPLSFAGTQLWLKADSVAINDSTVSQWYDCSGNNNNAIQNTPSKQPIKRDSITLLNYKPVVIFNGINNLLVGVGAIPNIDSSSMTVFIIASGASTINTSDIYLMLFGINNYNIGFWLSRHLKSLNNFDVYNNDYDFSSDIGSLPQSGFSATILELSKNLNVSSEIYLNGQLKAIATDAHIIGPFTNSNYYVGGALFPYQGYFDGDIAEILVYNKALTTTQRKTVEQYFRNKYAPPVNLGPDIWVNNFCDTTLNASPRFLNYKWSTGDTTSTISVNTGGAYWVSVTDVLGFHSSDTIIVHKPIIRAHDTLTCFGDSIILYTGLKAPFTFHWSGGSTADSLKVVAPSTDTLTVTGPLGCQLIKVIHVMADSFPVLASLGNDTLKKCTGDTINLKADAANAVSYDWYDGISHSHHPSYTVAWTSGSHTLSLTVADAMGCVANLSVSVKVPGAQPSVGFTYTPVCFSPTALTSFNDTSHAITGSINNYNWSFGDGTTAEYYNSNPFSHHYDSSAYYIVNLTDSTNQGCYKTVTHLVPVYSIPKPAFEPHLGCTGVPLLLNNISTSYIGNIDTSRWIISDTYHPQTLTTANALHTFDSTGWYHVHLLVKTQYGCTDSIIDSVYIRPAPKVGFSYSSACFGNPVYFTDTSVFQPWYAVISWNWNFGSGIVDSIENPVYTFNQAGTFPVVLTVKANNGCVVTDSENVVVHAIPVAGFRDSSLCVQSSTTFHDTSSVLSPDHISSWLWSFGSAGTSANSSPVINFPNSGAYLVTLMVTSNAGCQSLAIADSVHIFPIPDAAFVPDIFYGTPPLTVDFTNNSTGAVNYLWNFGDSSPTSTSPSHTYNDTGIYVVSLVAYNQYGCTDTAYQKIYAIHTNADIAVTNVNAVRSGNLVSLSASLLNLGTRNIYSIDLTAISESGVLFEETWTDFSNPLQPSESMIYNFHAKYEVSDTTAILYFCVDAQIVGYNPDDNESNNEQCLTLNNEFTVFDPYPSPTHDLLNFDFILPAADNVNIELFGIKGDKIAVIYSGKAQKGLNQLTYGVSNLSLAVYTIRILYKDQMKVVKFVKY